MSIKKFCLFLLLGIWSSFPRVSKIEYPLNFTNKSSSIPIREKIDRRTSYWHKMLASPKTGQIPASIGVKENNFSRKIPTIQDYNQASELRYAEQEWIPSGPFNVGGRTRGLALDIQDERSIVAGGVSGGIWKSTNEGRSWTRTSSPSLRNSVSCLAQDPRTGKENNWYFGTGELVGNSARSLGAPFRGDGLYKSTDNAETWQPLLSTTASNPDRFNSQFQYSWEIVVNKNKTNVDEIFVAGYGGILKSENGGTDWSVAIGERLFDLPDTVNLNNSLSPFYTNIKQAAKGYLIATLSSASSNGELYPHAGIYFSQNGDSWHQIQNRNFPTYHERTVIGIDNDNDRYYFFTQGDELATLFRYDLNEIINGVPNGTWTNLSQNLPEISEAIEDLDTQFGYNMIIKVHPENADIIFLGATNLYRSRDGFTSRSNTDWIGGYQSNSARYPNHHPDQHNLIFYPSNPSNMLSANDGGIFRTQNNQQDSVRWSTLNNGYISSQFYTINQQSNNTGNNSIGGLQDNGTYLRTASGETPSWNRIVGGDGGYSALTRADNLIYGAFQEGQVYRFSLNENSAFRTFTRVDPIGGGEDENQPYLFINPYIIDPYNESIMYLLGGNVVWRNLNLMQIPWGSQNKTSINWEELDDTEIADGIFTTIKKSYPDDIVYAGFTGTQPGFFKIENASSASNYRVTKITPTIFPEGAHLACIAINPTDGNEIAIVFSNYDIPSIFHSRDGGMTFSDVSGNLEEYEDGTGSGPSIRWLEIIPTQDAAFPTKYFVGTSTGVYSTQNDLKDDTNWSKEASSTIGNAVVTMMSYRDTDGRLLVATHGNGTFSTFIDNPAPFVIENTPNISLKAFPNPFNNKVFIEYELPNDEIVKVELYDRSGKYIRDLLWGQQFSGNNTLTWDGTNAAGIKLDQGVYFCKINSSDFNKTIRLLYLP